MFAVALESLHWCYTKFWCFECDRRFFPFAVSVCYSGNAANSKKVNHSVNHAREHGLSVLISELIRLRQEKLRARLMLHSADQYSVLALNHSTFACQSYLNHEQEEY